MLDLWEMLGRIMVEDNFRATMLNYNNAKPIADPNCDCRCVFDPDDYDGLRAAVAAAHSEIPISLAALGEWMLVKTLKPLTQVLQDIATVVQARIGTNASTDRRFYQVLGLSVIDANFGALYNGSNFGFAGLLSKDKTDILSLNADTTANGFRAKCLVFHDFFWHDDCKGWMVASTGSQINHTHLLDPDEKKLFNQMLAAAENPVP